MDRDAYLAAWSRLHGGYDPAASRLVAGWLHLTYVLARPLGRWRVPPDAVTLAGVAAAAAAVGLASSGGRWLLVAAAVVALAGLLDGLDGAVAVLAGRTSSWGYVLDSAADRCGDALLLTALWVCGAPGPLCVAAGFLTLLQEYVRARAAAGGMAEIGLVTVWERPTRLAVVGMTLLAAGLLGGAAGWATAGAAAGTLLGLAGTGQLTVTVRRRLRGVPAGDGAR